MLTFESEQFRGASGIIEKLKVRRPATSWKSIMSMNTECDPAYRHCRSKRSSTIFPPSTLSLRRLAKLVSLYSVSTCSSNSHNGCNFILTCECSDRTARSGRLAQPVELLTELPAHPGRQHLLCVSWHTRSISRMLTSLTYPQLQRRVQTRLCRCRISSARGTLTDHLCFPIDRVKPWSIAWPIGW
jgi:hypothetical protein